PSDLAEKLTCEPETDIRHCAASPELSALSGRSIKFQRMTETPSIDRSRGLDDWSHSLVI
ncbi:MULTISPECIES: hypothetical protein, partial [unclassified Sulfitobacter]|uniref:hypothetical protein n=1 Tax=unclassified Sulfitobacter TaxID=196795 RepID=UPI003745E46B